MSPYDTKYALEKTQMLKGNFTFYGYTTSVLSLAPGSQTTWRLAVRSDPALNATTEADIFPIGTHVYTLEATNETFSLNLNWCDDRSQFNCRDGSCISLKERSGK